MTIALGLKVNDGLVLSADSAGTIFAPNGNVNYVYNNANKVFRLRSDLPIGVVTWGMGGIGSASIATLMKDLRDLLADPASADWFLDPHNYTVGDASTKVRRFMFEDRYATAFQDWETKPNMGFFVGGYSHDSAMAEGFVIRVMGGNCDVPQPYWHPDENCGLFCDGQPEAIYRLVLGSGSGLGSVLEQNLGVPTDQVQPTLSVIAQALVNPLWTPAMPIQDAIDLAEFLVETTIGYTRFSAGAPTVGGPVDVAAITKHEGFKWIRRKHYYSHELNREREHQGE